MQALLVYGNIKNQFRNVAYTNSISRIWQAKRVLAGAWGKAKIQQTKMLVTCLRFGDLFLFGLVLQCSTNQEQYNKDRFKVIATYLQV